jgi:hypothetical protein
MVDGRRPAHQPPNNNRYSTKADACLASSRQSVQCVQSPGLAPADACLASSRQSVQCVQSPGLAPAVACLASSRQSGRRRL